MIKVSIIVLAYNAHKFLSRSIAGLVQQTLEEIEIIINDASTDDTLQIALEWKKRYPDKIVVIDSKINRKSGGARNLGFDIARGEYIGLSDADDYVVPNMYELLYQKAKEGDYDIVDSGFYNEQTDIAKLHTGDNVTGILDSEKKSIMIANGGYLVTKIFKSHLWNEPKLRMREKVQCLEDCEILIYLLFKAKSIGNVKQILYKYCNTSDSASKEIMDVAPFFECTYGAMKALYDRCKDFPDFEDCKMAVESMILSIYYSFIVRCLYEGNERINYEEEWQGFGNAIKNIDSDGFNMLQKMSKLKKEIVSINYDDNEYMLKRIEPFYINMMKECDDYFLMGI